MPEIRCKVYPMHACMKSVRDPQASGRQKAGVPLLSSVHEVHTPCMHDGIDLPSESIHVPCNHHIMSCLSCQACYGPSLM